MSRIARYLPLEVYITSLPRGSNSLHISVQAELFGRANLHHTTQWFKENFDPLTWLKHQYTSDILQSASESRFNLISLWLLDWEGFITRRKAVVWNHRKLLTLSSRPRLLTICMNCRVQIYKPMFTLFIIQFSFNAHQQ